MFINAEIGFTTYALYVIKANAPPIVNSPFIIKSPLNIYNNAFTTVSITTTLTVLYKGYRSMTHWNRHNILKELHFHLKDFSADLLRNNRSD